MVVYKCSNCGNNGDEDSMMVLAEWHTVRSGKIEDYIICNNCWEFNVVYENLPNFSDF